TNRIGDIGFFIGIALLFYATGTVNFLDMNHEFFHLHHEAILGIAAIFLFCGAIGKSAQFPLHVWLPDAMEGPTPVSALIHAATMVAAGVYLVARLFPLFEVFPNSAQVVAVIGTITACLGAFIAITATDIKKVLAYSTISQLGYMIAALGVGGLNAGTFHLMTHAFFKALLFLGAGSVIHGTGTQDIREMGGLLKSMPKTAITFIIGTIAIAGVPPFSGFWSKDEILTHAFLSGHQVIFALLLITAFFTAFYMFRLVFLTFFGKTRGHIHAHESPNVMTIPLMILAFFAIVSGLPGSPFMHHLFQSFMSGGHEVAEPNYRLMLLSTVVSSIAILLAYIFYVVKTDLPIRMGKLLKPLYIASSNKLWFDELYQATVIRGFRWIASSFFGFDVKVIDGAVNGSAVFTIFLSRIKNWFDQYIVDGAVNFVGFVTRATSFILRLVQTGFIHHYLFFLLMGLLFMLYGIAK
ncbi:MAG: NADH-quinone oxidoreductase subunit L, partial [Candidatus Omnitrophica bacterium]|nr:NADH-quinone oxidoreductase subunit L [Candidatus Omnitrophota bacterium]